MEKRKGIRDDVSVKRAKTISDESKQKPRPDIYMTCPSPSQEIKPGQLSAKQLEHYFEKGYLLIEDFFGPKRLDVVREAVNVLVDNLVNKLYNAGKIKNKYEDKGFFDRLTYVEKEYKGASVLMHKEGVLPVEFQQLWCDEKLLNVVEQMIGPDIAGHPVWNLRTKTPYNEQATVPWHQDNAYLDACSLNTLQVTAWIPLIDANLKNGCLQVASGGHRAGKTIEHTCCAGGTWYVELDPRDMQRELGVDLKRDVVTCQVPYGGVLFMNNAIPHRSLENFSDIIRWSLDLRWQRPNDPNGFYGLKENVLMRTSKNPDHVINWDEMAGRDRTKLQMEAVDEENSDQFVPEISGPWMKRWKIVHHNRHTERLDSVLGTNYHKA